MTELELKEKLTYNSLILNRHYKNFNPFQCGGKFKKSGVPIDIICEVMEVLADKKPLKPWAYAVQVLKDKKIQANIIQSIQAHENHKKPIKIAPNLKEVLLKALS